MRASVPDTPSPNGRLQGYCYLAAAMALVGSTVVASKIIAAGLPPFTATALRFALALPCFALLMRLYRAALPKLELRDWALLTAQAAAGSVGYTVLLIAGLQRASAVDAGIILGALPLVSAVLAVTLLGERPGRATLAAIAVATLGVWLTMAGAAGDGVSSLAGNALVLGAVGCEALFILLHKRLRTPVPPLALSTIMTGIGLAASALASLLTEAPWTLALPADAMLAVAYYALAPTVGGFLLWYAGAARANGAEAALFTALAPVCAVLLAAVVLGEALQARQLAGMACVLAAIVLLGLAQRPARAGR